MGSGLDDGGPRGGTVSLIGVLAGGRVIPSGKSKPVQPLETSVVRRILVAENDRVAAGDLLIELDPTASEADRVRVRREMQALQLDAARLTALTEAVAGHGPPRLDPTSLPPEAGPAEVALQHRQLQRQYAEYRASLQALTDEGRQKRAELAAIRRRLSGLTSTLPLLTEQAAAVAELLRNKLAPRVQWLELERQRLAAAAERDALEDETHALAAEMATLEARLESAAARYEAEWLAELASLRARIRAYEQETVKADQTRRLRELRAPVNGTVQQLAVHSPGSVVTPAQQLLVVVPDDDLLQVEAWVQNKDIGFVHEGQPAQVKVDTFPFTRYGLIAGELTKLSDDAVSDQEHGLVYLATVDLAQDTVDVDGRKVRLAPGMSVSVELHLGERRVIEFLLSPLIRYRDEAGRER